MEKRNYTTGSSYKFHNWKKLEGINPTAFSILAAECTWKYYPCRDYITDCLLITR